MKNLRDPAEAIALTREDLSSALTPGTRFILPSVCLWPERLCQVLSVKEGRVTFWYEVELLRGGMYRKHLTWDLAGLLARRPRLLSEEGTDGD